ncbi:GTPase [Zavarzinella formosa]|uniref:GTPase n=1 Tax=Zavarzinella formosa TaxID=360055 RepID=UPI0002EB82CF|nr:GTPase [Zavarzinella formosa]
MDAAAVRLEVSQLADDLSWLEDHSRQQPDRAKATSQLRLAASLVRNVIGPSLDGQGKTPIHVAVVGGAGTGKSTVVNFLAGSAVAEANPQAGYTRHPTAYLIGQSGSHWTGHLGFLGPLRRLDRPAPANLDEDVFQVVKVPNSQSNPLGDAVIWDCPDMTTWAASGYLSRLIEVSGLADVIVYVASDERYNDEVPTQFLHLLARTGKPVVVVLTKMLPSQATALVEHFGKEILSRLPVGPGGQPTVPVIAIPALKPEELADPTGKAAPHRIALLNQVMVLADPANTRDRTVRNSIEYLRSSLPDLLGVARQDLAAMDVWKANVNHGMMELERRYQNDFLEGEGFKRFDEARERLLDLLELPGPGKGIAVALKTVRFPYRFVRNAVTKAVTRPMALSRRESDVLEESTKAMLDQLQADALKRGEQGPFWKHVQTGFNAGLTDQALDQYRATLREYQLQSTEETESAARNVTAALEQNPASLATLRVVKLFFDLSAIGLGIWAGGLNWPTLIYVPVFLSITHQGAELIVWQFVEGKRRAIRQHKLRTVRQVIISPLTKWLDDWPVSGGSSYEKLQSTVLRIPVQIEKIRGMIVGNNS